jgi:hypothetical protein
MARPRQSRCRLGHSLTAANVRYNASGSAECLACARRRDRDWKRRHRANLPIVDDKQPPATIALVVWGTNGHRDYFASWQYYRTYADATAQAPADAPWTVVDISRKPWVKHLTIGKGEPMSRRQLTRLQAEAAAIAANEKQMRPHPRGLAGRCQDALDDLALLEADPHASAEAKQSARALADAMAAALRAETGAQ